MQEREREKSNKSGFQSSNIFFERRHMYLIVQLKASLISEPEEFIMLNQTVTVDAKQPWSGLVKRGQVLTIKDKGCNSILGVKAANLILIKSLSKLKQIRKNSIYKRYREQT